MRGKYLSAAVCVLTAACGRQPCPTDVEGPIARIDVGLNSCNHAPTAHVNAPSSVGKGEQILLDGGKSVDADLDPLTYQWTLVERPPTSRATLSGAQRAQASLQPDTVGKFSFEFIVSDGDLSAEPVSHDVYVVNRSPVADAGRDTSGALGVPIPLDGSASSDPDGDPLQFSWTLHVRPTGSTAVLSGTNTERPTLIADLQGLYRARLVVSDGEATSEPDDVQIGGGIVGGPPVASAGPDVTGNIGSMVLLDGSRSRDPDGDPLTYAWRITSNPRGTSPTLTNADTETAHLFSGDAGMYVVELTVSDGVFSATDSVEVLLRQQDPWALNGQFDPNEVYIYGTLSEGACYRDAIAHWSTPNFFAWGFECGDNSFGTGDILTDGRFAYVDDDDLIRAFVPDPPSYDSMGVPQYPVAPRVNDPDIHPPVGCQHFHLGLVSSTDGFWLICGDAWIHSSGRTISPDGDPVAFHDETYLTEGQGELIVGSSTGAAAITVNIPRSSFVTGRVYRDGYRAVLGNESVELLELWFIGQDGSATLEGTYPPVPAHTTAGYRKLLDGNGRLFEQGRDNRQVVRDIIIRRTIDGASEVVYDETNNPTVKLHISYLFTGP